jgi:hypothetical protein
LSVEQVSLQAFDEIYAELLVLLDSRRPAEEFRRIFDYPWRANEDHVGLALYEGRQVVGYVGLIFSELTIEGRRERLCNVTSLIAKETHRAEASLLVLKLRTLRGYTITNLSCNDAAYRLFTRMGFSVLDDRRTILYPSRASFPARRGTAWRVLHDPVSIRHDLPAEHQRILDDHLPYAKHVLAHCNDHSCYIVFTLGRRRWLRTARIHFVSDASLFPEAWPTVQRALWREYRTVLAECDARLLRGRSVPGSRSAAMRIPRLYRSDRLSPEQIPSLYSELMLLNLP